VGIIGINLSRNYALITEKIAPSLLIIIGVIYVLIGLRHHHHNHHHKEIIDGDVRNRNKWAIISYLALTMFLSPCLEIEAYYLQAATAGWAGILVVTAIYIFVTIGGMLLLVFLAGKGVQSIRSHFLAHYERVLSGSVLIVLGIISFFVHV
jgi:putative Mn2+ efflux pump MntP